MTPERSIETPVRHDVDDEDNPRERDKRNEMQDGERDCTRQVVHAACCTNRCETADREYHESRQLRLHDEKRSCGYDRSRNREREEP